MSKMLNFSDDLKLPLDAATQTFAFIARKGAGKTYAAGKLAELLIGAGVQVVVLDTVGNWYGLRIAADGKGEGLDVPVIGGLRGDVPLAAESGHLIADLVVDTGRSLVIDASQFSLGDRKRFATAFGEQLWKRKKGQADPSPIHMIIEESQLIIPQFVGRDEARMVGIFEEIVRLGRNYGIGVSMITQRPQSVNKEVLTQTEALVVGQVNGVPERKALKEWIVQQGEDVKLADELPGLHVGTMYFWSPQWLRILQKIKIAKKVTFDASSTPKVGEVRRRTADLKPINLDELKAKMADSIEKAKDDDPRELRRQIAELKKAAGKVVPPTVETRMIEKPVVTDKQVKAVESIVSRLEKEGQRRIEAAEALRSSGEQLVTTGRDFAAALRSAHAPAPRSASTVRPAVATAVRQPRISAPIVAGDPGTRESMAGPERKIVDALAWMESIGVYEPEQAAVAFLAGYTTGGGAYNNPRGALRGKGLIEYLSGDRLKLTDTGRAVAESPGEPLTTDELHRKVLERLPGPEQKLLKPLLENYPNAMSNDDLAAASGYSTGGGAYNNPRGRLRTLGLVEYRDNGVAARSILFVDR